jgi:hypothetical protein
VQIRALVERREEFLSALIVFVELANKVQHTLIEYDAAMTHPPVDDESKQKLVGYFVLFYCLHFSLIVDLSLLHVFI